jgi:hypothetical protein
MRDIILIGMLWSDLRCDLRYALRLMRRSPGFTAVALLSLALGIGANTAIFSLFNTVMLRTLPVAHPEQLVEFLQKYPGEPRGDGYWGWASYEYYRDNNHVFSAMTGMSFDNLALVRTEGSESETVIRENVLGNYFQVLGLNPAIGRLIVARRQRCLLFCSPLVRTSRRRVPHPFYVWAVCWVQLLDAINRLSLSIEDITGSG